MTYRVLGPAVADLRHIQDWVTGEFGEAAAFKARRRLLAAFGLLARFQEMGTIRPEFAEPPVRFYAQYPNWIVYTPGDPLLIHRVFSARMDVREL